LRPLAAFFQNAAFLYTPVPAGNRTQFGSAGVGPLGVNEQGDYATATNAIMLANADIEPDADRDGFGDETQDACPINAATQGACPAVPIKRKKCKKRKKHHSAAAAKKKRCKRKKHR
jgi:hypothetical protein